MLIPKVRHFGYNILISNNLRFIKGSILNHAVKTPSPAAARPAFTDSLIRSFTHSLIQTSPVVFRLRRNTDKTTFHLVTGHRPLAIESRNLFKESALHSIATPFDRSGGGLSLESRPEPAFRKDYPVVRAAFISWMSQARA